MDAVLAQKLPKIIQYGQRVWNLKGDDKGTALEAVEKTYDFFESLGLKMSLSDWDIDSKNFAKISAKLVKSKIGETPLAKKQIDQILKNCLK